MPRTLRAAEAGMIYHVLNRGNGRLRLFHKESDYLAFERVMAQALERYPVKLLCYCLMPNHWHLLLQPTTDDALGRWLGWLGVTHVRRHHEHYHTRGGGHLYQGRYKSFPVQDDRHLLIVARYIEANAARANLVKSAENWHWCSMWARLHRGKKLTLSPWPVDRPGNWRVLVNEPIAKERLEQLRTSVNRGRPFGEDRWVIRTAERLDLQSTLRDRGRPPKEKKDAKKGNQ